MGLAEPPSPSSPEKLVQGGGGSAAAAAAAITAAAPEAAAAVRRKSWGESEEQVQLHLRRLLSFFTTYQPEQASEAGVQVAWDAEGPSECSSSSLWHCAFSCLSLTHSTLPHYTHSLSCQAFGTSLRGCMLARQWAFGQCEAPVGQAAGPAASLWARRQPLLGSSRVWCGGEIIERVC